MVTRIYIHVGLHKTGSTSIQAGLAASRTRLAESGYSYPMCLGPDLDYFGHPLIPWAACTRPNYLPPQALADRPDQYDSSDKIWSALRSELDSTAAPNVILSSEEFDILSRAEIETIGARLKGFDIVPVMFLRRHSDFLESAYRTTIIHSATTTSATDFARNQRSRLDYRDLIRDWLAISCGSALVINYDAPSVKKDSLEAFIHAIGARLDLQRSRQLNDSQPAFVCELVRFMRAKGCSEARLKQWVHKLREYGLADRDTEDQWCLPSELVHEYDARYNDEITAILEDRHLKALLWNEFSPITERAKIIHIASPVHALLALAS